MQLHDCVAWAEALGIGRGLVSYRAAWQKET